MWTVITHSPAQTEGLGHRLGRRLSPPALVALAGELGSGKTCLAQGILRGIGVTEAYLTSPSYILVQEYAAKGREIKVYHMDVYRLETPQQIEELGYQEYLGSQSIGIIEWAEKIEDLLPEEYLKIKMVAVGSHEREIQLIPYGSRYEEIISQVRSNA